METPSQTSIPKTKPLCTLAKGSRIMYHPLVSGLMVLVSIGPELDPYQQEISPPQHTHTSQQQTNVMAPDGCMAALSMCKNFYDPSLQT